MCGFMLCAAHLWGALFTQPVGSSRAVLHEHGSVFALEASQVTQGRLCPAQPFWLSFNDSFLVIVMA